jgi:hypothetical protein
MMSVTASPVSLEQFLRRKLPFFTKKYAGHGGMHLDIRKAGGLPCNYRYTPKKPQLNHQGYKITLSLTPACLFTGRTVPFYPKGETND